MNSSPAVSGSISGSCFQLPESWSFLHCLPGETGVECASFDSCSWNQWLPLQSFWAKLKCLRSSAISPFLLSMGAIEQIQEFCLRSTFYSFSTHQGQLRVLYELWVKRSSRLRNVAGRLLDAMDSWNLARTPGSLKKKQNSKTAEQDRVMTEWRETERLVGKKCA